MRTTGVAVVTQRAQALKQRRSATASSGLEASISFVSACERRGQLRRTSWLPWRRVTGQLLAAPLRERFLLEPIAWKVVFAVFDQVRELLLARGDRGHRLRGFDQEAVNVGWSLDELGEDVVGRAESAARSIRSIRRAPAPRPRTARPLPWMNSCRPFRVLGFRVLNSWSRSVTSLRRAGRAASRRRGSAGLLLGPGESAM